jgi:hypothetical protein
MLRRDFLKTLATTGTLAALGKSAFAALPAWRQFEITYQMTLQSQKTPVRVWIPVPQDALDYQKVLELSCRSPVATSLLGSLPLGHRSSRPLGRIQQCRAR